jgi:hypothetical protein
MNEDPMKEKNLSSNKKPGSISPEAESLAKEAVHQMSSWAEDPDLFLSRLGALPPQEWEGLFLSLMKSQSEEVYPLIQQILGREERIDLALAGSLGRWNAPEAGILLHRLASKTSSKMILKSIRKSIFRLKTQGIDVQEIGDSSPAVFRPPQAVPSEGFVSSLDPAGTRFVWLVRPQLPQGVMVFHALVSDTQGMIDFQSFEASRKKFHQYLEEFRKNVPWEIVEAAPDYCLGLMNEAAEINQKKEQTPPGDFLEGRALMGTSPPLPLKPLIYQFLNQEEWKDRSDLLDRSPSLFQLSSFQDWFLEEEEGEKYLGLLKESSESPLVLSPYQKEARFIDIYRQAVNELFDPGRKSLYRRRLEEMAYFLWKTGKESDAQLCLVAALGMEMEGGVLSTHPFLLELVKRTLTARMEEEARKKAKETDLLIKP